MIQVLICEDDRTTRMLLKHMLTRATPCQISEVANGVEALAALSKKPFDLLLLDLSMPVMGGLETLRGIRATPATRELPVLILSGEKDEQQIKEVISLGVLDFLLKPIGEEKTRDRLRAALARLTMQQRTAVPAGTASAVGAASAVAGAAMSPPPVAAMSPPPAAVSAP